MRAFGAVAAAVGLCAALVVPANAACPTPATPAEGYRMLFDGTEASLANWSQAGPGAFTLIDCELESTGGMGLLWYSAEQFEAYTLRLDWKIAKVFDNSGVFVGFPNPGTDPWVAVNQGYEIQIDEVGRMDAQPQHYTGAIYDIQGPDMQAVLEAVDPVGWNTYEITVDNPQITIAINGVVVNEFTSTSAARDLSSGYFGLQNHGAPDVVRFRNVQVREFEPSGPPPPPIGSLAEFANNTGIAQNPTSNANFDSGGYSYSALALQSVGVEPGGEVTAAGFTYTWPDVASGVNDNVVAGGQQITLSAPAGATRLGLLAAADHGPSTGTFTLVYEAADGTRENVAVPLTFSDWTLNAGAAAPSPANTIAITSPFRTLQSTVPEGVDTHVFSVAVPLDATRRLVGIELPRGHSGGGIHLFALDTA